MKIVIDNSKPLQIKIDKPDAVVELKARKTMAGDIMIFDHPDIDIMVSPSKNKIFEFLIFKVSNKASPYLKALLFELNRFKDGSTRVPLKFTMPQIYITIRIKKTLKHNFKV